MMDPVTLLSAAIFGRGIGAARPRPPLPLPVWHLVQYDPHAATILQQQTFHASRPSDNAHPYKKKPNPHS